jgi:hypothetical protein
VEKIRLPKPSEEESGLAKKLSILSVGFGLVAAVVGLLAQVIDHFQKPRALPQQRTTAGSAMLALMVLRALPGIIKTARTLAAEARH